MAYRYIDRELWQKQMQAQEGLDGGVRPGSCDMEQMRAMALAGMIENAELMMLLPWKPWKHDDSAPINMAKAADELADELRFWLNRCLILGITCDDMNNAIERSYMKHEARNRDGYHRRVG